MKTLRRSVIVRDSDLDRLMTKIAKTNLYDRVDYEPLTYQGLQNENLVKRLRNPNDITIPRHHAVPNVYAELLARENNLYDRRYLNWSLTYDFPAGQIYVQTRENQLCQPMYRVYLERDYD